MIGSEFDDAIAGAGGSARGLGGAETCSGFASTDCGGATSPPPGVTLEGAGGDPGLLVRGGPGAESITVAADAAKITVTSSEPLAAEAGCASVSAGTVTCAAPAAPLGYATVWSGGGGDQVSLGPRLPRHRLRRARRRRGQRRDRRLIRVGDPARRPQRLRQAVRCGRGRRTLLGPGRGRHVGRRRQRPARHLGAMRGPRDERRPGPGGHRGLRPDDRTGIVAQLGGLAFVPGAGSACRRRCAPTARSWRELRTTTFSTGPPRADPLILGNEGDDVIYGRRGADTLRGERGRRLAVRRRRGRHPRGLRPQPRRRAQLRRRAATESSATGSTRAGRRCVKGERRKAKRGKKKGREGSGSGEKR